MSYMFNAKESWTSQCGYTGERGAEVAACVNKMFAQEIFGLSLSLPVSSVGNTTSPTGGKSGGGVQQGR